MARKTCYAVVVLVALSGAARCQDPMKIVNHFLDTVSMGHVENWDAITSVYMEEQGAFSNENFNQSPGAEAELMKPSFTKVYMVCPGKTKRELYDDPSFKIRTSSFYFLPDKTVILIGNLPPIVKNIKSLPKACEFIPATIRNLIQESRSVKFAGIKKFNDSIECYQIDVRTKEATHQLSINTRTYLLEYMSNSSSPDPTMITKFASYKRFGDYLIPVSTVSFKNNVPFHWNKITRLEQNVPIEENTFNYPTE